jgi:hypothetical protein
MSPVSGSSSSTAELDGIASSFAANGGFGAGRLAVESRRAASERRSLSIR